MQRWWWNGARAGALLAALLGVVPAVAARDYAAGPYVITADGTYPSATAPWQPAGNATVGLAPVAASLHIETAGSGTVSVALRGYGPHTGTDVTNRATWLIGTLNASVTHLTSDALTHGVVAVVTGCTGCTIRVGFGGRSDEQ